MSNFNYYLITDPTYYSNNVKQFEDTLTTVLKNKRVDSVCFRDKTSDNIDELAQTFIHVCKAQKIENIFINQNLELAKKLNFDGVHLTSMQFDKIHEAKESGLKTIISCHTFEEIQKAVTLNCDTVTYSPIFLTPNKGLPKGIKKLKDAVDSFDIDIIALGGIISNTQIQQIQQTQAKGFASIRYFI